MQVQKNFPQAFMAVAEAVVVMAIAAVVTVLQEDVVAVVTAKNFIR